MLSNRPDPKVLYQLAAMQRYGITVLFVVSSLALSNWVIPGFSVISPGGWDDMKFGSALGIFLSALSLVFVESRMSPERRRWGRFAAFTVAVLGAGALAQPLIGAPIDLARALTPPWAASEPLPMSAQTAFAFVLFGLAQVLSTDRREPRARIAEGLNLTLLVLTVETLATYLFMSGGAEQGDWRRASPLALACLCVMAALSVSRRVDRSLLRSLLGVGIGSRIARPVLPLTVVMPFLFVMIHVYLGGIGGITAPLAAALTATVSSAFFFGMLVVVAGKINAQENDLRELSLTDNLTGLLNSRGFELLGGQAMREAQRNRQALSVFFFDLDGLKQVNDRFGHDVGSDLIVDLANLLKATFRDADIPARIGGDEFAVVFHNGGTDTRSALARLEAAVSDANAHWGRPYRIAYSVGEATAAPDEQVTIAQLLTRADAQMYVFKRGKQEADLESASHLSAGQ